MSSISQPISFIVIVLCSCNQTGKTSIDIEDSSFEDSSTDTAEIDFDGDGFSELDDCDDQNPLVHPQMTEICNEIDDNCNGTIDEGVTIDWFFDFDTDGYGAEFLESACSSIPGAVTVSGDCDDNDPRIFPTSTERIDGLDSNCDGSTDWLVTIYVAVDDAGELCINNQILGDTGSWTNGKVYEKWMTTGPLALGIYGWDVGYQITAGIAHIEISDGSIWTSDSTWLYSPNPNDSSSKDGWCTPAFDDTVWEQAQDIGPIGISPWGNAPSVFPQGSPARWIWDYYPVALNSQYLRKVITLP